MEIREFQTSKKKVSQHLCQPLSLGPITHEYKRTAHIPALGMWRHFGSGLQSGVALPRHPPAPVRKRVVNLLRLTPGFVSDVYLVCKKCFYLLSKYVWAQRVMMLLYRSGRETMVKGCKCWPLHTHACTHTRTHTHTEEHISAHDEPTTITCRRALWGAL